MQNKTATVIARVTPAEKRSLTKAAKADGKRLSEWVRAVLFAETGKIRAQ